MIKKWTVGVADAPWKVTVCGTEAKLASDTLGSLIYILTDAGDDKDRGASLLQEMSGVQIVEGLIEFQRVAAASVERALSRR